MITTVAENGTKGFAGDGGRATSAQLAFPEDVAVDAGGNLYISDYTVNRIRKVSGGTITTLAGTSAAGSADEGGPAASAQINGPAGSTPAGLV